MLVQVPRSPEHPDEHQLGGGVRVQRASDEEVGDRDAVRRFRPGGWQRGEGRAGHLGPEIVVRDDGEDDVEARREALQDIGGLHRPPGFFHLRYEDEEHEVARVGEYWVCNGHKGGHEVGRPREINGPPRDWVQTRADHADDPRDDDGGDGGDAEPREAVERSRKGEEKCWNGEDARVEHQA